MNEKFYEALEVCLQAIESGAEIESVLKRYPQMAGELRPILETSVQAQSLVAPSVPEDAIRRGRARVLQHAAEMSAPVQGSRRSIFSFPRLATSLALAFIFILSGTGLVRASDGALPGDNLYPIKRTWEGMRLHLVFDPDVREELEDEFEQERLHEIDELLAEGRHEKITFAGLVTDQNGEQWVVSGISVQITPDSKLPADPVTVGASIIVEGHTNAQGHVEADRVDILERGISLPTFEPAEIEKSEDADQNKNSVLEDNENSFQDETELKTIRDHNNDNDNSDESSDNEGGDDNRGSNKESGSNNNDDGDDDSDNDSGEDDD